MSRLVDKTPEELRAMIQDLDRQIASQIRPKPPIELWSLEYSEYSEKVGMYPWHIDYLERSLEGNIRDFLYGNRQENKWQIVFIGTFEACQARCEELIRAREVVR